MTHVLVAGGGLAGVAAATVLAEGGVQVTLVEREPHLGGRVAAWTDKLEDGTPFEMERGFHAFFRQYYNLRALLKRVDPALRCLKPLTDYPILGPDGNKQSFAGLAKQAPLNVIDMVRRTETLKLNDLIKVDAKAALQMLSFDPEHSYRRFDQQSARAYLDSLNFPAAARRMLFDVFSHSFFNPEEDMSAAEMLAMFHFYFMGNPEGLLFDVMRQPFSKTIWEPFERYLADKGVKIFMPSQVSRIERRPKTPHFHVHLADASIIRCDAVVLALNVPGLKHVVNCSPEIGDWVWREQIQSLDVTLPFAVWRLWLDAPVNPERDAFVGTAGLGILDNISLYHLFEDESRRWAARANGSVVELHAYAVDPERGIESIKQELLDMLHRVYPETVQACILEERFLLRRDCPAFQPGSHAQRPTVASPDSKIVLAGDFVKLDVPTALMERAVTSGMLAANVLLHHQGLAEEPIKTVPSKGLLPTMFHS